jgi:putative ABC transport system permease protein
MGQFWESAAIALQSIWANKLRSFLTVLGNIVAVTSIIAVVSLIQGMNAKVTEAIVPDVGADNFTIQRMPPIRTEADEERVRNNPRITLKDAAAIRRYADQTVGALAAQAQSSARMSYGATTLENVQLQGVTRDYLQFAMFNVGHGRMISPTEIDRERPLTLLGAGTAEKLFGQLDPIDKVIRIGRFNVRVVGVSEKKGAIFGQSQDEFAVIPLGMFEKMFGTRINLQLLVKPRSPEVIKAAMDDATVALRVERRLGPSEPDNFGIFTSDTLLNFYYTVTSGIFAVLIGVVALSLVVGGIVIMNIMLMVVSERTREIGLRKALGARRRDIMWQILTESVTLSTFGGLVGTSLGFGLAMVIAALSPLPAIVEPWSIAMGLGITAVVGLFFGLYPAMRASKLDPIEALRRE